MALFTHQHMEVRLRAKKGRRRGMGSAGVVHLATKGRVSARSRLGKDLHFIVLGRNFQDLSRELLQERYHVCVQIAAFFVCSLVGGLY